ncbi:MAG TPA: hypothetical protein DDY78_12975 [Planctomycetales bacterium]|jgi:peroxiredoxin|nr:hypothetical protein [Planctomycetales bacterium]
MCAFFFKPPGAALAARSAAAVLVAAAALAAGGTPARAEFKVGAELPEFSLKAADGTPFSLQRKQNQMGVVNGDKRTEPKALVLHLFQPDCLQCQAQLKELEKVHQEFGKKGVLVVGVSHRGDAKAVQAAADQLKVTFPLLVGTDSALAKKFGAGDAFAIADQAGVVRFAQAGYGQGDEKLWREDLGLLLAGKPVAKETVDRKRLKVGDRLPSLELDSLLTGKPLVLNGEDGKLTFRDEDGTVSHPKAAIVFFSRY